MANLIIKPADGGSLILQDEGGDAALTVGTTGVSTIANATITTGDIVASSFPAGHVVQTIFDSDTGTDRTASSASFADMAGLNPAITIRQANSKILVTAFSSASWGGEANGSSIPELIINLKRVITGGATTDELISGGWGAWIHSRNHWGSIGGQWLDAPAQAVGTVITYSIRAKRAGGAGNVYWMHGSGQGTMSLQEIAV